MFETIINGTDVFGFAIGDSKEILMQIPDGSIDCVITSPPYWQQRVYEDYDGVLGNIIGSENTTGDYVENLMLVIRQIKRVLKDDGTF